MCPRPALVLGQEEDGIIVPELHVGGQEIPTFGSQDGRILDSPRDEPVELLGLRPRPSSIIACTEAGRAHGPPPKAGHVKQPELACIGGDPYSGISFKARDEGRFLVNRRGGRPRGLAGHFTHAVDLLCLVGFFDSPVKDC